MGEGKELLRGKEGLEEERKVKELLEIFIYFLNHHTVRKRGVKKN